MTFYLVEGEWEGWLPLHTLLIPQIHVYVQETGEKVIRVQLISHQGMAFGVYGFAHLWRARCYVHAQWYLTLCDPMNGSLPGSSVHGILQARVLQWVANTTLGCHSSSRGSSRPRDRTSFSCIRGRFFTSWAIRKALGSKVVFPLFPRQWLELCPEKLAPLSLSLYIYIWRSFSTFSLFLESSRPQIGALFLLEHH